MTPIFFRLINDQQENLHKTVKILRDLTEANCWTDNTTAVNSDASSRRNSVLQRKGFEILYYTINLYNTKIIRHIQIHTKGKIARK